LPVVIHDIINNASSAILFSKHSTYKGDEKHIGYLKGTVQEKTNMLNKYKKGEIKVLFLSTLTDYAGLRLENTTDIIALSNLTTNRKKQIIGRALRLGRNPKLPLTIHVFKQ